VEGVLGEECLAELGVAQLAVVVLVEASHEERNLVIGNIKAEFFKPVD